MMDTDIVEASSPNFGVRRGGASPDMIVLHYTGMTSADAALELLCDPASEVSSHYLVAEDGRVWRLVPETERAWHAGVGTWGRISDVNSCSIGIELANAGPLAGLPPFPEPQMSALERLLDGIMLRWSIHSARVIGHSDMAPLRKIDPGPKFDWRRLARCRRAVWVGSDATPPADWPAFCEAASVAGYGIDAAEAALAAFRLRFRPWALGRELEAADVAGIHALAAEHPCVDRADVHT